MKTNFMQNVYDAEEYTPFDFYTDYTKICKQFNNIPVTHNNYAIVIKTNYQGDVKNKSIYSLFESGLLMRHKLAVLKYHNDAETACDIVFNFKHSLLVTILAWEEKYISMITDHFKDRSSEGKTLNNHNSIKIQVGKIVSDLVHANQVIKSSIDSFDMELLSLASNQIKAIALDLHKISGGRAFLQENIVEMLCVFEIFRKIYFMRKPA